MSNRASPPPGNLSPSPEHPKRPREDKAARRARLIKQLKELPTEDRQKLAKVNRLVLYCMATTIAAMVTLSLPLPWPAIGMVLAITTVVLALTGLVKASKVPLAQSSMLFFGMGLAMSAIFALYSLGLIMTWTQQWEYQQCLSQAQTVTGQDQCTAQFKDATKSQFGDMLRGGR